MIVSFLCVAPEIVLYLHISMRGSGEARELRVL
jgi:hypothetical protein